MDHRGSQSGKAMGSLAERCEACRSFDFCRRSSRRGMGPWAEDGRLTIWTHCQQPLVQQRRVRMATEHGYDVYILYMFFI